MSCNIIISCGCHFRALLSISEISQHSSHHVIRADALDNVMAIAMDVSTVFIWKTTKVGLGASFKVKNNGYSKKYYLLFE